MDGEDGRRGVSSFLWYRRRRSEMIGDVMTGACDGKILHKVRRRQRMMRLFLRVLQKRLLEIWVYGEYDGDIVTAISRHSTEYMVSGTVVVLVALFCKDITINSSKHT